MQGRGRGEGGEGEESSPYAKTTDWLAVLVFKALTTVQPHSLTSHNAPDLTFKADYWISQFNLEDGGEVFFRNVDTHFQAKIRRNDDENNV